MELKAIKKYLHLIHLFSRTAIYLNTTVPPLIGKIKLTLQCKCNQLHLLQLSLPNLPHYHCQNNFSSRTGRCSTHTGVLAASISCSRDGAHNARGSYVLMHILLHGYVVGGQGCRCVKCTPSELADLSLDT